MTGIVNCVKNHKIAKSLTVSPSLCLSSLPLSVSVPVSVLRHSLTYLLNHRQGHLLSFPEKLNKYEYFGNSYQSFFSSRLTGERLASAIGMAVRSRTIFSYKKLKDIWRLRCIASFFPHNTLKKSLTELNTLIALR